MATTSSIANGTQTAVISTEHTLSTQTGAKSYRLKVNLSNLTNGDIVELRAKSKVLTGGSEALLWYAAFSNVPANPVVMSPEIPSDYSLTVTLKQTAGTGRQFEWELMEVGIADVTQWNGSAPNNLISGRVDASAGAVASGAITSSAFGTGAIDANAFAQAAADKTWSTTSRTLSAFGFSVTVGTNNDKTGYALSAAGVQAIWDALTSALTTVGSIGKLLVDNINATISSRLASASYSAPPSAATVAGAVWDEARASHTNAGSFGQGVASVQGNVTGSVASVTAGVTVSTNNDKTGYSLSVTPPTAAQISTQVWSEAIPGAFGAGTAGAKLNSAGSAGDPWTTALPGAYSAGSAGYILGTNLNATVSSRSTLDGTGVQSALTSQGYTTTRAGYLDTLNGLVTAIWAAATRTLTGFAFSVDLSTAATQAVWDKATSALTTASSIGKLLVDNVNATISSRSTYAGADTSGTTTLLSRIPGTVQPQTGDAYARLGAPSGASVSADVASIKSDTSGLRTDYTTARAGKLDNLDAAISTLPNAAAVKSQVVAALTTDTYAELSSAPNATSSLKDKLTWMFMNVFNKHLTTATSDTLRNDSDNATVATAALSDDGTTFTRGKYV